MIRIMRGLSAWATVGGLSLAAACGGGVSGATATGGVANAAGSSSGGAATGGLSSSGGVTTGGATGGEAPCTTGDERCACYPNDTCNDDLTCASNLCVRRPGTGGGGGAPSGSGGSGGVGGAPTGGASGSGGTGGGAGGGATNGGGTTTGGAPVAGGAAGAGGTAVIPTDCTYVTPCGGNVVGSWSVESSCLELTGNMDVSLLSLDCAAVPVTGYLQTSGTFVANANGTYSDNTTTTGAATFSLAPSCLSVSSVVVPCDRLGALFMAAGWSSATCAETDGQCSCAATVVQQGGLGQVLPYTEPTGSYLTDGTTLTASNATYTYCVAGDTLSLTPQMSALRGTIVLHREGPPAAGGARGSAAGGAGGTSGGAGR